MYLYSQSDMLHSSPKDFQKALTLNLMSARKSPLTPEHKAFLVGEYVKEKHYSDVCMTPSTSMIDYMVMGAPRRLGLNTAPRKPTADYNESVRMWFRKYVKDLDTVRCRKADKADDVD